MAGINRIAELSDRGEAMFGQIEDGLGQVTSKLEGITELIEAVKPAFDVIETIS